jgi:hypothetical protein
MMCVLVVVLGLLGSFSPSAIDDLSTKHQTLGMTCGTSDGPGLSVADGSALHLGECRGPRSNRLHVVGIEV